MNIFFQELKANLKSLIIWLVIMSMLIMVGVAKFSAFAGDPEMLKMLDAMPPAMLDALNMRAFNLTTLSGFYGIMFVYFSLLGAIAGAMWGSDIISKEERDRTVEFSLVLPVSRSRVITAKALAALVNCIVFMLVTWGISLAAVQSYKPDQAYFDFLSPQLFCIKVGRAQNIVHFGQVVEPPKASPKRLCTGLAIALTALKAAQTSNHANSFTQSWSALRQDFCAMNCTIQRLPFDFI